MDQHNKPTKEELEGIVDEAIKKTERENFIEKVSWNMFKVQSGEYIAYANKAGVNQLEKAIRDDTTK
jgi:hypothetical protein